MRDIEPNAPAPCRASYGVADCRCSGCLTDANRVAVVMLAWADDRDIFVQDHEEEGALEQWYWDGMWKLDEYVIRTLDDDPERLWDLDHEARRDYLLAHPSAGAQAPCRLRYSPYDRCSCPEHHGPNRNSLGTVAEDLWTRRRTLREFRELGMASMFSAYDARQLEGIEAWLAETLELTNGEMAALTELTNAGLSLAQAARAMRAARG